MRSTTRPSRISNTWTTAPAGPTFRPNASRSPSSALAIFCWRVAQRLDRADRVAQLRRLLEPLGLRGVRHPVAQRRRRSSSLRPSRNSCVCSTATRYSLRRTDRAHARRDAALDVELEARPAALAGDDLVARPNAEQPVRQRHRPARRARPAGTGRRSSGRRARRAGRRARAGRPRPSSAAGTG